MPDSITYGTYSFPSPLPYLAESDNLISLGGKYDHKSIDISIIGSLTGANLSGLHLQKMQMISGFLDEYQDLTVSVGVSSRVYGECLVKSIEFAEGDLSTVLPYTVNLTSFESEAFSQYFGIQDPVNTWEYAEQDNKIIQATHNVSAQGIKVNATDPFDNARFFVTGILSGGFQHIGLFNTGSNAFLTSRTENIDKKNNKYSVTEVYSFSASDDVISDSGIVSVSTNINYNKDGELSVTVQGSVQGSIDACVTGGLLTTGNFTPNDATEVAINSLVNSLSDFESGVYQFVTNGPSSFEYSLNTGSNKLDFSFGFENTENLDLIGNVLHSYDVSIQCSKDQAISFVNVQGSLKYRGTSLGINSTGNAGVSGARFIAVQNALAQVNPFLLAREAISQFTGVATGYEFNSSYLREEPESFSIQKDPINNEITYDYTYNNSVDYSSGQLKDFTASIVDSVPLQLVNVEQTITGYGATVVANRTLGQYSVSASANNPESDLPTLKVIVSGLCSGKYELSNSENIGVSNITFNLAKYY